MMNKHSECGMRNADFGMVFISTHSEIRNPKSEIDTPILPYKVASSKKWQRSTGLLFLVAILLAGCGNNEPEADAYGNFEAVETLISAEASGRLVRFDVDEGDYLKAGQVVGLVDTVQLALKRDQLAASRRAVRARMPGVVAQVDVLQEQIEVAETERRRIQNLLEDGAATKKQLDDIEGQIRVLQRQIESARTQNPTILSELDAIDAQIAQVEDQIQRSIIVNPVAGRVLVTYAEPHELTSTGRPLYQIAPLDTLILRAYVSGAQLPHLRLGQPVEVQIDEDAATNRALPGTLTWIASEAEFTPKLIQTKEERVNLVYAIKVRVPNPDGALKIGMPGEVWIRGESGREGERENG